MKKVFLFIVFTGLMFSSIFAFDDGFVFGMKARFSGSYTDPYIDKVDLDALGANKMDGQVGFIMDGEFELGYIFDSLKYFKMKSNNIFGGLGLTGYVGVGQGFTGQKTEASTGDNSFINVFSKVSFTPVVRFGSKFKFYLFKNRFVINLGIGGRMIADPSPDYMAYSDNPKLVKLDVGSIIVTAEDRKKMNPFGATFEFGLDYIQPVLPTTELIIGSYMSYTIYKPGAITIPPSMEKMLKAINKAVPEKSPSYYLNSFDFGISIGLNFKA